jgi:hypothetical protein
MLLGETRNSLTSLHEIHLKACRNLQRDSEAKKCTLKNSTTQGLYIILEMSPSFKKTKYGSSLKPTGKNLGIPQIWSRNLKNLFLLSLEWHICEKASLQIWKSGPCVGEEACSGTMPPLCCMMYCLLSAAYFYLRLISWCKLPQHYVVLHNDTAFVFASRITVDTWTNICVLLQIYSKYLTGANRFIFPLVVVLYWEVNNCRIFLFFFSEGYSISGLLERVHLLYWIIERKKIILRKITLESFVNFCVFP